MGCSIKFVRLDDFISDIDSIDLSTGGYSLAADGYFQTVAPIGAKSVHEVITLKIQGTSKDNLAALIQDIDEKIKQVEWWINDPSIEKYQIWIRVQLDGETYSRQAQILTIQPPDKVKTFTPTEINNNYIGEYQIGIERTPFWEDAYPYPTTTKKSNIGTLGGKTSLSETIYGDVPARLASVTLSGFDSFIMGGWIGFKSSRFGDQTQFVSNWKLDNFFLVNNTSVVVDSTAVSGNNITCTFATSTALLLRAYNDLSGITPGNSANQRGTFSVLLRAKMSDSSIARVRIGFGFAAQAKILRSRQVISGTDYKVYEMGNISIPSSLVSANEIIEGMAIEIEAERISGSGNLIMDCLVLIPTEGMIKFNLPGSTTNFGVELRIYQKANGALVSYSTNGPYVLGSYTTQPINWSLPANGDKPIVVYCGNDVGDVKSYAVDFEYTYIPRWRTLRGSST